MPREVWRHETAKSARLYRLVDARPDGTAGEPQYTIERLDRDAMGGERWIHVEVATNPDLIWNLLVALSESHIEKRPVTFAVREATEPAPEPVDIRSVVKRISQVMGVTDTPEHSEEPDEQA